MKTKILTGLAIVFAFGMVGIYWYFVGQGRYFSLPTEGSAWANLGSYVGGVFAALAFLVVVYQNYERDKEQRKQDFERTFFMMLEHHNAKLTFLESKGNGEDDGNEKRSIVDTIYNQIIINRGSFDELRRRFEISDYSIYYSDINVYFLNLYRILKFIYKNREYNIKNEYSSLLRSFLSRKLLVILAYHLCKRNDDESYNIYIKLINDFSFFEHIDLFSLEINFISHSVEVSESFIYEILSNVNKKDLDCINDQIEYKIFGFLTRDYEEGKDRLPTAIEAQRVSLLQDIIKAKVEGISLKLVGNDDILTANNYDYKNVFLHMLALFDRNAFHNNIRYPSICNTYNFFIESIKQETK